MTGGPEREEPPSRMEHLLPGIPVVSKIALGLGVAGGLFGAIVASYTSPDHQYMVLLVGLATGAVAAIILAIRAARAKSK